MNYDLAKQAQELAEKISMERFGTKAMAELCLPEAYEQIKNEILAKSEEKQSK